MPSEGVPGLDLGAFASSFGLRLGETSSERAVATWEVSPAFHQGDGLVHGGVHSSVVETLAGLGAALWMGDRGRVVTVANTTDLLRPVREGTLVSTATPASRGRHQQVWVVTTVDEQERLVCQGAVRLQNLYRDAIPETSFTS